MDYLWRLKATSFTKFSVILCFSTLISCYVIAVALGHVKPWLPMISDCAVDPPEKYIFRLGIIPGAWLLNINSLMMLYYVHTGYFQLQGTCFDKFAYALVSLGTSGMTIVGACNEDENNTLHTIGAVIFFVCYQIYIMIITIRLYPSPNTKSNSIIIKTILTIYSLIALIIFAILSLINFDKYHTTIAFCEWTSTFAIILYNLSFCHKFGNDLYLGAFVQDNQLVPYYVPQNGMMFLPVQDGTQLLSF